MAKELRIQTPRGTLYTRTAKSGTIKAVLKWDEGFGQERTRRLQDGQKYIDSEVLRLDAPYMPIKTGMLIRSGDLGTVIGSGEVSYIAPYAAVQYYKTATSRSYDAMRGARWFERMKIDHKDQLLRAAAKITGGKQNGR